MTSEHNGGGSGCGGGAECGETHCQPDSTSKRNLVLQAATVFFQRGLQGCHPHGVQTKQAIPQCHRRRVSRHIMPAHMGGKRKKLISGGPRRLRSGYSRGRKRTKQVIFRSLFWARAGSFGELESGFASGVRSNFRKTHGESVIGACPRSSWWRWEEPAENSLADSRWHPTKTFEVRFGDNNNMEKLKTTTLIELTHNF